MGEEDSSSFLSSCVLDISSFALRPRTKNNGACYAVYEWLLLEDLLCNVYARVKAGNEPAGDRPGAGEIKVRSCYTGSSVKSSKMRKSRHLRKFQAMITYITASQRVPGQLQFNDCTRPSPRGSV